MKCMARILFTIVLLSSSFVPVASAQAAHPAQALDVYELVLKDGSRLFGTIENETDQEVVFKSTGGAVLTAKRIDIVTLRRVSGRMEEGRFMRSDEHRSRLFFAPTGRSLRRGQVSVGVFEFLAPFVQVGVTDRISMGGGTPLVFGFEDFERPFWITPKVQVFDNGKAQAAVGVLHVFDGGGESAGIGYGVATFGSADNAITVGAGIAYDGEDEGALFMIGGERRVRSNLKFTTENYITKSGNGIMSGGLRFIGGRLSADLALAVPIGLDDFVAFPVVNFMYVFK